MKRGTPDHPKTKRLARALGISLAQTVGHLELLWHFTAKYAPRGDVGRFPDAEIEEACDWAGTPGALARALAGCGWLDPCPKHRLVVHDWNEHADDSVKKLWQRKGLQPVETCPENGGTCPEKICLPLPLPLPLPEPEEEDSGAAAPGCDSAVRRKRKPTPDPPDWSLEAAEILRVATLRRWPGCSLPATATPWAREIARVGAASSEIASLMAWYCDPKRDGDGGRGVAKYHPEIRSGATFRAKWNQLLAAKARAEQPAEPIRLVMRAPETYTPTRDPGVDYEAERAEILRLIEAKRIK